MQDAAMARADFIVLMMYGSETPTSADTGPSTMRFRRIIIAIDWFAALGGRKTSFDHEFATNHTRIAAPPPVATKRMWRALPSETRLRANQSRSASAAHSAPCRAATVQAASSKIALRGPVVLSFQALMTVDERRSTLIRLVTQTHRQA